jgi:arylformamidase
MTSRYFDLSHPIEHEIATYPGLPGPAISTYISPEKSAQRLGTGCRSTLAASRWSPTPARCVDAPYHFHAEGAGMADLPLERLVDVPIVVVRASGRAAIGPEVLDDPGAL